MNCAVSRCSAVEIIRPHQGRRIDPDFKSKWASLPHLCCGGDNRTLPWADTEEAA